MKCPLCSTEIRLNKLCEAPEGTYAVIWCDIQCPRSGKHVLIPKADKK